MGVGAAAQQTGGVHPGHHQPDQHERAEPHMQELQPHQVGLNMAAHGSTSVTMPSRMVNPVGSFIQEFTETTQKVPTMPDIAIGISMARCSRGGMRSQP